MESPLNHQYTSNVLINFLRPLFIALTLRDFTEVEMKFDEKDIRFQEKLDSIDKRFQSLENNAGHGSEENAHKISELSEEFNVVTDKFGEISNVMENVLERFHEFEVQRKNNLLFYGVTEEHNESSVKLLLKIRDIIRSQFGVQVSKGNN